MQTLKLKDDVATQLQQVAEQTHLSANDLIKKLLCKYAVEEPPKKTLNDFFGILKDSPTFRGDPIEIQRKMRDEWD
ncbi:hypothetical protein [Methyloprofundus sp.]|uniref:hypothetical protein n=1 Tax=Methyloprofundus sp. TaxID=2020875 RepID=UPI003D0AD210